MQIAAKNSFPKMFQGVEGGGWERPLEEKVDLEKQESGENFGQKRIKSFIEFYGEDVNIVSCKVPRYLKKEWQYPESSIPLYSQPGRKLSFFTPSLKMAYKRVKSFTKVTTPSSFPDPIPEVI